MKLKALLKWNAESKNAMACTSDVWRQKHVVASNVDDLNVAPVSDTSSIDHLVMSEFVSGSPRYRSPRAVRDFRSETTCSCLEC